MSIDIFSELQRRLVNRVEQRLNDVTDQLVRGIEIDIGEIRGWQFSALELRELAEEVIPEVIKAARTELLNEGFSE